MNETQRDDAINQMRKIATLTEACEAALGYLKHFGLRGSTVAALTKQLETAVEEAHNEYHN